MNLDYLFWWWRRCNVVTPQPGEQPPVQRVSVPPSPEFDLKAAALHVERIHAVEVKPGDLVIVRISAQTPTKDVLGLVDWFHKALPHCKVVIMACGSIRVMRGPFTDPNEETLC